MLSVEGACPDDRSNGDQLADAGAAPARGAGSLAKEGMCVVLRRGPLRMITEWIEVVSLI